MHSLNCIFHSLHLELNDKDDMNCGNFRKPNMSSANPVRRELLLTMKKLWYKPVEVPAADAHGARGPGGSIDSCSFIVEGTFPLEAQQLAGAQHPPCPSALSPYPLFLCSLAIPPVPLLSHHTPCPSALSPYPLSRGSLAIPPVTLTNTVPLSLSGAPQKVLTSITVSAPGTVDFDVVWLEKRPTRLAESIFFSFQVRKGALYT
jgi:hypothetical protein